MGNKGWMKIPPTGITHDNRAIGPLAASNLGSPGAPAFAVERRSESGWVRVHTFERRSEAMAWVDQASAGGEGDLDDFRIVAVRRWRPLWVGLLVVAAVIGAVVTIVWMTRDRPAPLTTELPATIDHPFTIGAPAGWTADVTTTTDHCATPFGSGPEGGVLGYGELFCVRYGDSLDELQGRLRLWKKQTLGPFWGGPVDNATVSAERVTADGYPALLLTVEGLEVEDEADPTARRSAVLLWLIAEVRPEVTTGMMVSASADDHATVEAMIESVRFDENLLQEAINGLGFRPLPN